MTSTQSHFPHELVQCRQEKSISLRQISESTKIGVHYLEAIERGDFKKLPCGIYASSYLRQYARAVNFDESALLRYYEDSMKSSTPVA
jgi:cytoskeletal protein RodZ